MVVGSLRSRVYCLGFGVSGGVRVWVWGVNPRNPKPVGTLETLENLETLNPRNSKLSIS